MDITSEPITPRISEFWDIISSYVKDKHPRVTIDPNNSKAGGYRFRVLVSKNTINIIDAGKSPGMKAPEDFPHEVVRAVDPDLFKKLSKVCRYRGRGGVCVYQEPRKLKSNWVIMAAPDLVSLHGIDTEKELIGEMVKSSKKKRRNK